MKYIIKQGFTAWYKENSQPHQPMMGDGDIVEDRPSEGTIKGYTKVRSVADPVIAGAIPTQFLQPIGNDATQQ